MPECCFCFLEAAQNTCTKIVYSLSTQAIVMVKVLHKRNNTWFDPDQYANLQELTANPLSPERQKAAGAKNLETDKQACTIAWKQRLISRNTVHRDNHGCVCLVKHTSGRTKFQCQTHDPLMEKKLLKCYLSMCAFGLIWRIMDFQPSCNHVVLIALVVGMILLQQMRLLKKKLATSCTRH